MKLTSTALALGQSFCAVLQFLCRAHEVCAVPAADSGSPSGAKQSATVIGAAMTCETLLPTRTREAG
jgi:hypothetical protein